ncbi:hypothetical protein V5799_001717 [Amblyomma americanum]|uniref:Vezatin n=1 Tax=Amblyomma americanum TaxID=6943 RepID=A0AAQ4CZE1_AMBAM
MNEMDSDDDGVILPNSPLYAHLTEAGFELPDMDLGSVKHADERPTSLNKTCHLRRSNIVTFLPNVLTLFMGGLSKAKSAALHLFHHFDGVPFLERILESPCLDEEDQRFLRNLLEAQDLTIKKEVQRSSFFACSVVAAVGVCLVARCLSTEQETSAESVVLGFLACALLLVAGTAIVKYCLLRQYRASIDRLLATMQDVQAMIRKCLQIIQEAEVVARGFTLASHNVPLHRIEMNMLMPNLDPQRQCPELRRSLEEGTDNFSLSALKAMLYLMYIQQSEFLRRLSLCLMPGIKKSCLFDVFSMKTIVNDLGESIQAQLRNFSNAYQFYKSSQVTEELERRPSRALHKAPHELHTAAHSLGLHLLAALKRAQAVESMTESIGEDTDIEPLEANLSCLLAEVKAELASSSCCLEEASVLLDKKLAPKLPVESTPLELPSPITSSGPVVVIKEDDIPVVEDEVFEAMLPDRAEPDDVKSTDDYDLSSEKMHREASAVVFKELKSVLVIKAKEHREREKNALARTGIEGGHFDKLGFVMPEAEGPPESSAYVGDCPPTYDDGAAARSTTPLHKTAMGDERSEGLEFQLGSGGEAVKQEMSGAPADTVSEYAPLPAVRMCLPNPRNLALMAAIRSRQLAPMEVRTFENDVSSCSSEEDELE